VQRLYEHQTYIQGNIGGDIVLCLILQQCSLIQTLERDGHNIRYALSEMPFDVLDYRLIAFTLRKVEALVLDFLETDLHPEIEVMLQNQISAI